MKFLLALVAMQISRGDWAVLFPTRGYGTEVNKADVEHALDTLSKSSSTRRDELRSTLTSGRSGDPSPRSFVRTAHAVQAQTRPPAWMRGIEKAKPKEIRHRARALEETIRALLLLRSKKTVDTDASEERLWKEIGEELDRARVFDVHNLDPNSARAAFLFTFWTELERELWKIEHLQHEQHPRPVHRVIYGLMNQAQQILGVLGPSARLDDEPLYRSQLAGLSERTLPYRAHHVAQTLLFCGDPESTEKRIGELGIDRVERAAHDETDARMLFEVWSAMLKETEADALWSGASRDALLRVRTMAGDVLRQIEASYGAIQRELFAWRLTAIDEESRWRLSDLRSALAATPFGTDPQTRAYDCLLGAILEGTPAEEIERRMRDSIGVLYFAPRYPPGIGSYRLVLPLPIDLDLQISMEREGKVEIRMERVELGLNPEIVERMLGRMEEGKKVEELADTLDAWLAMRHRYAGVNIARPAIEQLRELTSGGRHLDRITNGMTTKWWLDRASEVLEEIDRANR